jgi:hypothetical protein
MIDRLVSPFREFGLFCGALYAADRLLTRLSPRLRVFVYDLMVQPIPLTPILAPKRVRNLSVRELKSGDPDLSAVVAPPPVQRSRFAQNSVCLATYSKNRLVGYIWLRFESYEEDEVRCTFVVNPAGKAVFDFDLVVLPEYRMGFGFAAVWHCTNEYLRNRGVHYTFSRLTRFNLASRRAHAHLGCKRAGSAVILKLWAVEIIACTLAPYFYLSSSQKFRARMQLHPTALSG